VIVKSPLKSVDSFYHYLEALANELIAKFRTKYMKKMKLIRKTPINLFANPYTCLTLPNFDLFLK
jgi:hypothetical protein